MTAPLTTEDYLRDALEALERVPCQFWHCKGPDFQPVYMSTCYVCREVRRLRRFFARRVVAA